VEHGLPGRDKDGDYEQIANAHSALRTAQV
jgi:hypothetical protein